MQGKHIYAGYFSWDFGVVMTALDMSSAIEMSGVIIDVQLGCLGIYVPKSCLGRRLL